MPNYVYFIKSRSRIKIGISKNVAQRFDEIGKHLERKPRMLGSVRGTYALERYIHARLAAHWIKNEWFSDCPEVRSLMGLVLAGEDFGHGTNHDDEGDPTGPPGIIPFKFAGCAKYLWPSKTASQLASITGNDERTAKRWLRGQCEPPSKVFATMMLEMLKREGE